MTPFQLGLRLLVEESVTTCEFKFMRPVLGQKKDLTQTCIVGCQHRLLLLILNLKPNVFPILGLSLIHSLRFRRLALCLSREEAGPYITIPFMHHVYP